MALDILFVNCFSYEFFYIPLGTFGLCDYLSRYGISSKIVNLSLYAPDESNRILIETFDQYSPRYVGLILHWKESLSSFLKTGANIKRFYPNIKIVSGGITASYYARELVSQLDFIDCVIRGDAELPLHRLLFDDSNLSAIENIVFRSLDGSIVDNRGQFSACGELLSSISFSELDYLIDYERYIRYINKRLGFPLSVGRGCDYNCQACGGSKFAFRKHSDRNKMALRSPEAVIHDIENLYFKYGVDNLLLSHVNEIGIELLDLIRRNDVLRGKVVINLEAWGLPDEKLLSHYKAACRFDRDHPGILHISPETMVEADRRKIKDPTLFYTNAELCSTIDLALGMLEKPTISLFFSYPNSSHDSGDKLEIEYENIQALKTRYAHAPNVHINLLTLSSDPGSLLNESNKSIDSSLNLRNINQSIMFDRNLSSNLLLHRPKSLSPFDLETFERTNTFDELFATRSPCVYKILAASLGYGKFRETIRMASEFYYYDLDGRYYPLTHTNTALMLNIVKRVLQHDGNAGMAYCIQLLDLFIAYEISRRLDRANTLTSALDRSRLPEILTLNNDRVFIGEFQFLPLITEITASGKVSEKTLSESQSEESPAFYLFLPNSLISLEMQEYGLLSQFNGLNSTSAVIESLSTSTSISPEKVSARVTALYLDGILI